MNVDSRIDEIKNNARAIFTCLSFTVFSIFVHDCKFVFVSVTTSVTYNRKVRGAVAGTVRRSDFGFRFSVIAYYLRSVEH